MPDKAENPRSHLKIRSIAKEGGILFADPLEVKTSASVGGGVMVREEILRDFGQGNAVAGVLRVQNYLEAMLQKDGTILPTLGIQDGMREAASRVAGFEEATSAEEVEAWQTKLQGMDEYAVAELLNKIETWEKSQENN